MKILISLMLALVSSQAGAHGENKPGPNGGYISMPGAFHVELVPIDSRRLKVYLLDMAWKNPTLKDSSVSIVHSKGGSAKCQSKADHYLCEFPKSVDLSVVGDLEVTVKREQMQGNSVKYSLPLKLKMEH